MGQAQNCNDNTNLVKINISKSKLQEWEYANKAKTQAILLVVNKFGGKKSLDTQCLLYGWVTI